MVFREKTRTGSSTESSHDLRRSLASQILLGLLPDEDHDRPYTPIPGWPDLTEYRNSETGKRYEPHSPEELAWVKNHDKKNLWALGGEGGGKSVSGIMRDLERAKRGCSGIMTSPDLPHFQRSLWAEMRRWIPWDFIIQPHRRMASRHWQPSKPFMLVWETGAVWYLGGMTENDVMAWEGPNINFWHFDEIRRYKTDAALKVIDGRVRIPGPLGDQPQVWFTTTPLPKGSWMWHYTGPIPEDKEGLARDDRLEYKRDRLKLKLPTRGNLHNLTPEFLQKRAQTLTDAEAALLLEADEEIEMEGTDRFLPSMVWWDALKASIPPLTKNEPMVLAADAAVGRQTGYSDCFGLVGVTRHPDPKYRQHELFVRYVRKWQAAPGQKIDFNEPREEIRRLCREFQVVMLAYDIHQLHDMMSGLSEENIVWAFDFSQAGRRLQADRQLLDLILEKRIWHDGNSDLREHIDNADKKLDEDGRRLRIVKREDSMKVDLCVCLSMASFESLRLNL